MGFSKALRVSVALLAVSTLAASVLWFTRDRSGPGTAPDTTRDALSARIQAASRAGDHARAARLLREHLDSAPDDARTWRELGELELRSLHEPAAAARSLRRALDLDERSSDTHLLLGYALLATGDYDGATAELQAALSLAPDVAWAADVQKALIEAHLRKNAAGAPR